MVPLLILLYLIQAQATPTSRLQAISGLVIFSTTPHPKAGVNYSADALRPKRKRMTKMLAANTKVMMLAITTGQASISKP